MSNSQRNLYAFQHKRTQWEGFIVEPEIRPLQDTEYLHKLDLVLLASKVVRMKCVLLVISEVHMTLL